MEQIPNIFKAYDIRGLVDTEIDADFAFATGVAFARFLQIEREPGTIVIGEDMRPSSPELAEAFSAGATSQGMDVIRIGLASTDIVFRIWKARSARCDVYCKSQPCSIQRD
jgi:phosphomannomutase